MISNRCQYALLAMLELARHEGSGPLRIAEIARAQHIPARFLEAILRQLKQSGMTRSTRGKEGGYFLARPASDIVVGEVIRLIEGPLFGSPAQLQTPEALQSVWDEARTAASAVYNSISFADLAQRDRLAREAQAQNYSI